jgi:hypothetical protein
LDLLCRLAQNFIELGIAVPDEIGVDRYGLLAGSIHIDVTENMKFNPWGRFLNPGIAHLPVRLTGKRVNGGNHAASFCR